MNRILMLAISGIFALMLTACGEEKQDTAKPEEAAATATEVKATEQKSDEAAAKTDESSNAAAEGEGAASTDNAKQE